MAILMHPGKTQQWADAKPKKVKKEVVPTQYASAAPSFAGRGGFGDRGRGRGAFGEFVFCTFARDVQITPPTVGISADTCDCL